MRRVKAPPELAAKLVAKLEGARPGEIDVPEGADVYLTEDGPELCLPSADYVFKLLSGVVEDYDWCIPALPIICAIFDSQSGRIKELGVFDISEDGRCIRLVYNPDKLADAQSKLFKLAEVLSL